ncbi:hypothetical protein [Citrobacter freundii]|uniref:hypothetical protein n=1 Tax=Citrobacter freundii TaxID=546 RepID=UPI00374EF758
MNDKKTIPENLGDEKYSMEILFRKRVVMMILPLLLGIIVYLITKNYSDSLYPFQETVLNLISILLVSVSFVITLMIYLQTGFKRISSTTEFITEKNNIQYHVERNIDNNSHDEILSALELLENEIAELKAENTNINQILSPEEKSELIHHLKNELIGEASKDASRNILSEIKEKVSNNDSALKIELTFKNTLLRLKQETESLSRRGNLNLILGILTTIIGLLVLGYFVVEIGSIPEDKMAFIASFIPRLSLVILIEVFAYFFLKLYKSSLSEIKYFQNEMTNIEAKYAAIQCVNLIKNDADLSSVINILMLTERNALLEKGQTTAEIEMAKIETKNISAISDKVLKLINTKKGE